MRRPIKQVMLLSFLLFLFPSGISHAQFGEFTRYQEPDFLNFEELKALSIDPDPGGGLAKKLQRFWTTPIISNEAYYRGAKPHRADYPRLGPSLTLASWNIEKSFHAEPVIKMLNSPMELLQMVDSKHVQEGSDMYKTILRQRERLIHADVVVLQEMDIGHKRSGYINAAAKIAKALDMNYAYGAEQLEVEPVYLGTENILFHNGGVDQKMTDYFAVDPKQYKGVFGSAVLSRYPIKHVEVFQLHNQAYDWYWEKNPKQPWSRKPAGLGRNFFSEMK